MLSISQWGESVELSLFFLLDVFVQIVPGDEELLDAESRTILHECFRGRLAAVIGDQSWLFFGICDALRELIGDSKIQSLEPVPRFRLEEEGVADDFFCSTSRGQRPDTSSSSCGV